MDEQIVPSTTGLRWLYQQFIQNNGLSPSIRDEIKQISFIFNVLSGSQEPSLSSNPLAMAGAGVCIYRQVLSDPHLSPDSIARIRVVPGYISHAGSVFKTISSIKSRYHNLDFSFDALSTYQSVDAIVQETEQDSELAAAYPVKYTNRQGKKKYLFLSLSALLSALQPIVRTFKCEGDCSDLPTKALRDDDRPFDHDWISSWRKTRRHPLALFDQAASHNAQRLIADLQHLHNLWVSTSVLNIWNGDTCELVDTKMLIDRPFMMYLSLMEDKRSQVCVFPLVPCLGCMIEHGNLARLFPRFSTPGSVRLAAPGRTEAEMRWEWWMPQEPPAVSRKENRKKEKNAPL